MAKNNDIVFRRIHGHIVPIRVKNNKAALKGAGLVAAGVAVSAATGEIASKLVKSSAALRAESKAGFRIARAALARNPIKQMSFTGFGDLGMSRLAVKEASIAARVKSMRLFKARNLVLGAGLLVAGTLTSIGLRKIWQQSNIRKKIGEQEVIDNVVTTGVAALGFGAYYTRLSGLANIPTIVKAAVSRAQGLKIATNLPIKFSSRILGKGVLKF